MAVLKVTFTKSRRDELARALYTLNWVSVITGLVLFSSGLFLKLEIQKRRELMGEDLRSVPDVLIVVGLAACGINFLGGRICCECADADRFAHWKLLVFPYSVCTLFLTFCILVGGVMCCSMRRGLEHALLLGLQDAMRFYKDTDTPGRCYAKQSLDLLQIHFRCCGNDGFTDWFHVQWVSNRYLDMSSSDVVDRRRSNVDGKYLLDGVPFSCCNLHSPRPCIQERITNSSAHYNYDYHTEELNLNPRGCRRALLDHYTHIVQSVGFVVLAIWLFELAVLTGVRYLQTSMENVLKLGNPESESDGWLLENSITETARYNFNIIKNLGKCYRVDDDPNIDVPRGTGSGPGSSTWSGMRSGTWSGTGSVPSSTRSVPSGTESFPSGTESGTRSSTGSVPSGTESVPSGTGRVPSGTGSVQSGTGSVPSGTGRVPSGTGSVPSSTGRVLSGTGRVLSGTGRVLSGTGSVRSGTGRVLSGTGRVPSGTGSVPSDTGRVPSGTGSVPSGTGSVPSGTGRVLSGTGRVLSGTGSAPTLQIPSTSEPDVHRRNSPNS